MGENEKRVFVVTSGDYSSYSIEAVFDNRELAESFVGKSDADIEEYVLNETSGEVLAPRFHCKLLLEDGSIVEEWGDEEGGRIRAGLRGEVCVVVKRPSARMGSMTPKEFADWMLERTEPEQGVLVLWATSHVSLEHARKLAAEGRQAWLRAGKPEHMQQDIEC